MLFDSLTEKEKTLVEKSGTVRTYAKGNYILREGDRSTSLFVIRAGVVEVRKPIDSSKYKQLKDITAGYFFGEMSFLTGAARSADVLALRDAEILELSRADLDRLVDKNPVIGTKIYRNIAEELADRLRRNNEELKTAILWAIEEMVS